MLPSEAEAEEVARKRIEDIMNDGANKLDPKDPETRARLREVKNPGEMPEAFFDLPDGIVKYVYDHALAISPRPNRVACLGGALAFTSLLMGRRYMAEDGTRPNLYICTLAGSGCGKDGPRKANRELALDLGIRTKVCDTFRSGAGLEDAVLSECRLLCQYDEFDTLFRTMKMDSNGSTEDLSAMMLTLYGDVGSSHSRRQLSKAGPSNGKSVPSFCVTPYLTILGSAIPEQLYSALTNRIMTNGLFARCIILPATGRPQRHDTFYGPTPETLVMALRQFADCSETIDGKVTCAEPQPDKRPNERIIGFTPDARRRLAEASDDFDAYWEANDDRDSHKALWARAYEKVVKLSLVFAVSSGRFVIEEEDVNRATDIVEYSTRKALYLASIYCSDNEFHDLCLRIKRKLEAGPMFRSPLLRVMHVSAKVLQEALDTMRDSGVIVYKGGTETNPKIHLVEGREDD